MTDSLGGRQAHALGWTWALMWLLTAGCTDSVSIPIGDGRDTFALHAIWEEPPVARGTVVLVHGLGKSGNDLRWIAEDLMREGFATLRLDLRGHGQSEGRFPIAAPDSFGIAATDVAAAVRWIRTRRGAPSTRILALGQSLGGGAVLGAALRDTSLRVVAWYPGMTYLIDGDSLVRHCGSAVQGLIIHGDLDSLPRANAALSARFASCNRDVTLHRIRGGRHGVGSDRSSYREVTLTALRRMSGE